MRNYSATPSRCPARRLPDPARFASESLCKMVAAIRSGTGPVDAYVISPRQDVHPFYEARRAVFERAYGERLETPQPRPAHFPAPSAGETSERYLARWILSLGRSGLELHSVHGRVFSANERCALVVVAERVLAAAREESTATKSTTRADFNDSLEGIF